MSAVTAPAETSALQAALRDPMPTDRLVGWTVTLGLTALAFVVRVIGLGYPDKLVFDETYYPKDAWSLLHFGYEREWPADANERVVAGETMIMGDGPAFVVHPPLGKWLIAGGEALFGMTSFGWRFSACVFGALLVLITIRLVRRITRSTLLGGAAGVLLTFDGLAFVMSRIGLLDGFQAFFLVAGVSALVADRDWFRTRLADHLLARGLPDLGGLAGPLVLWRPWRVLAGVMFGMACGVKWSSLYVVAAFGLLSVAWDVGARRLAGASRRSLLGLLVDGIPAFVSVVVLGALVYLSTWAGWLATQGGYYRDWGRSNPESTSVQLLGAPLASLLHYHSQMYGFHTGDFINNQSHGYDADPIGWLVLARTIGIDAVNNIEPGVDGCPLDVDRCQRVITGIGTPLLWWVGAACLVVAVVWWLMRRDWRFGVPVVGVASTWLPWFQYTDRPTFLFYAVTIIPFTVLAVCLLIGLAMGPPDAPRRRVATMVSAVFVALVVVNFIYFHPVWTDALLSYREWAARMWLRTWI
ncbi:phospholipid carrier-dependent glycosyltransferase [Desertihabitans brevis]|uniref:Polyprenol-phosphate-mannose--protein mannosyltransferase n=2 Tax=Desertihabitans brevis TaxID=2268447 RepID=A0A367YY95_9ACTN|nr:phospholipid carrier-dependent glycosyltransferase [Desertihabitans brevis]